MEDTEVGEKPAGNVSDGNGTDVTVVASGSALKRRREEETAEGEDNLLDLTKDFKKTKA